MIHDRDPDRLGSVDTSLRGDVETIAAKALEKDKSRRYASAAALAADLRRFLAGEPIMARPASAWYQFRKFARRNKAVVGGVAATFAALLVAGIGRGNQFAWREADQRRLAERERHEAVRETYRARLGAAVSALRDFQTAEAARHLREAPESCAVGSGRHLHAQLDDSIAVVPASAPSDFAADSIRRRQSRHRFPRSTDAGGDHTAPRSVGRPHRAPPSAMKSTGRQSLALFRRRAAPMLWRQTTDPKSWLVSPIPEVLRAARRARTIDQAQVTYTQSWP